jgi:hypothetical protein
VSLLTWRREFTGKQAESPNVANRQQPVSPQSPGEVRSGVLYRADELKERMGWSDSAFRSARRRGLKVCRDGKRAYILGEDVIAYMKSKAAE